MNSFFGHQRWIGGYAIQNPKVLCFFYLVDVCSVNKEFHVGLILYKCVQVALAWQGVFSKEMNMF
jgi:hypothetical protein